MDAVKKFQLLSRRKKKRNSFPALPVNFETKEKSHQAQIFFVTSSCSKKLVEHIYFVDIIQFKELCIVLKEFTAAFVGFNKILHFFVFFGLRKAILFEIHFFKIFCVMCTVECKGKLKYSGKYNIYFYQL